MSVLVIAEAGVNHNGSLDLALALVDAAAEARADVVKFQTFDPLRLVSPRAPKAEYQTHNDGHQSQLAMLKALQLSEGQHDTIVERCKAHGIRFMSTGFDEQSLRFLLDRYDMPGVKIPSGEVVNARLLLEAARSGKHIYLSTGMCSLADIERALGVIAYGMQHSEGGTTRAGFELAYANAESRSRLQGKVTLLHCTTEYPAPFDHINLRVMDTLRSAFGLPVGYSDHSEGIVVSLAAVARGAVVIEKHFTLDRSLPGPDHAASLLPQELANLVSGVRHVTRSVGSAEKAPSPVEVTNRTVARQSLVAALDIAKGETFTTDNLTTRRPGDGIPALAYFEYLGRTAARSYRADDPIEP